MLRAVADFFQTVLNVRGRILFQRDIGEPDDGVHRRADIVGHVVEKGAFSRIGGFRLGAQTIQFPVCFLLQPNHPAAALHPDKADRRQQHQQRHHRNEDSFGPDGGVHHVHGADRHSVRRDQQHQKHVVVLQRGQAVEILRLVQTDIRRGDAVPVQLLLDLVKAAPLHILHLFQRLEHIPGADGVIRLRVKIGQRSVAFEKVGRRAAAVGLGGVILLHGLDVLQKHHMGKAHMVLPHGDGGIQFPRKHQKAAVNVVGFRDKGMLPAPVYQMADVVPDAHRPVAEIRGALRVQQHHPATVQIGAEHLFQKDDVFTQRLLRFKMLSLHRIVQSFHQVPVGLKAAGQVGLDLGDHFLQLTGTFLHGQLHQGFSHEEYARHQRNH